ncbi:unnamed protein product [Owenia fusiformis]|uniref:Uncharacterized protein n=1 Tax=Owenia fusiformis TaxID=6347 RepID=A0A8J1TVG7_OWEFU|nr:unnamed protein product [Owenia fusiformis]
MEEEIIPKLVFFPPEENFNGEISSKSPGLTPAINIITPTGDDIGNDEQYNGKHRISIMEEISVHENKTNEVTTLRDNMFDCIAKDDMGDFPILMQRYLKLKSEGIIEGLTDENMLEGDIKITLLQKAVLFEQNEAIEMLLPHCDKKDIMHRTSDMGEGGCILHDAVAKDRQDVVKILVNKLTPDEMKILLSNQAVGSFFKSAFQGHELPLFIACWIQNLDMIRLILSLYPESIYIVDSNSLNFLHCLVRISQEGCPIFAGTAFRMIWQSEGGKEAIEHLMMGRCSSTGQTPMQFALRRGELKFVQLLLSTSLKSETMRYGPARFNEYDITDLEMCPEVPTGGGLPGIILIATSSDLGSLPKMLNMEPWKKILQLRWNNYKLPIFISFLAQFIMLILMAVGIVIIPRRDYQSDIIANYTAEQNSTSLTFLENAGYLGTIGIVVFTFHSMFILYGVYHTFNAITYTITLIIAMRKPKLSWDEIYKRLTNPVTGNGIYIVLDLIFGLSTIIGYLSFFFKRPEADVFNTLQIITGFILLTFYYRCLDYTSFFTVTVNKMLYGDVIRFLVIAIGYLFGFGVGFYIMYKNLEGGPPKDVENIFETLATTYKLMIGLSDFSTLRVQFEVVLVIIYVVYSILMTVMLFNLLIGIMANTINDVADQKDYLGELQRLSTVIYAETQVVRWWKPFASRCVENGSLKIKTVMFAGKNVKRLFIECLEVITDEDKDERAKKKFIKLKDV